MGRYILILAILVGSALWLSRGTGTTADSPTATPTVAAPAATATSLPTWPGPASRYLGRYHLTASNNARWAHTGGLTVFLRTIRSGIPPAMSGVLALYGKNRSNVFYLTQFVDTGTQLKATVNLGAYVGPIIGQIVLKKMSGKTWKVAATIQKAPKLTLTFVRFSKNPHP